MLLQLIVIFVIVSDVSVFHVGLKLCSALSRVSLNRRRTVESTLSLCQTRSSDENSNKRKKGGKGFGKIAVPESPVKLDLVTSDVPVQLESPVASVKIDEPLPTDNEELILRTELFKKKEKVREANLIEMKRRLKEEEDLIASDPSVGAVPEVVANRMIGRIAAFFGIPVFGGLSIFVGAFFYSKKYEVVVPPTIIAYATQAPFILGLAGISYAILSSSWDPEVPGSALGIEEFKINWQRIKEGLSRTRETAELRENIEKQTFPRDNNKQK